MHLDILHPYLEQIDFETKTLNQTFFNEALVKLEPLVEQLMRSEMTNLLNTLYRLDVSEEKVKYILFGNHEEKASKMLAEAILQREIVRKIFRQKYQS
jgi:hypothetical protein